MGDRPEHEVQLQVTLAIMITCVLMRSKTARIALYMKRHLFVETWCVKQLHYNEMNAMMAFH